MKKQLFMEKPFITSYPTHANTLSSVSQFPQSFEWYYENYVQIFARPTRGNSYVNFYVPYPWRACPFFSYCDIPREIINAYINDITIFLNSTIDHNYYVLMYLDRFYISKSGDYGRYHMGHDTLIFGYDNELKQYNVADFYDGQYQQVLVPFNEIQEAYNSTQYPKDICDDFNGIVLYKIQECSWYKFDILRYKRNIQTFLEGIRGDALPSYGYKTHNFTHPDEYVYGINVFQYLKEYLKRMEAENNNFIDFRGFHFLYDHIRMAVRTVDFLEGKGYMQSYSVIQKKLRELEKKITILRNKILKKNIISNAPKNFTEQLLQLLSEVADQEIEVFGLIYSSL